jgi:hypothetical protein
MFNEEQLRRLHDVACQCLVCDYSCDISVVSGVYKSFGKRWVLFDYVTELLAALGGSS